MHFISTDHRRNLLQLFCCDGYLIQSDQICVKLVQLTCQSRSSGITFAGKHFLYVMQLSLYLKPQRTCINVVEL